MDCNVMLIRKISVDLKVAALIEADSYCSVSVFLLTIACKLSFEKATILRNTYN